MLVYFLNFFEIIPMSLLYIILMKERPALWKLGLWGLAAVLINTQLKPLMLGQNPSASMNILINVMYWLFLIIPAYWIFRKPLHYSLVTGFYIITVVISFQLFVLLIITIIGQWISLGDQPLLIGEAIYYITLLLVELFRPDWLYFPHYRAQAFVSRRPNFRLIVDVVLLALFFLLTSSFIYEVVHELPQMTNRFYLLSIFVSLFTLTFIVLLKMIISSHQKSNLQKDTLQMNEVVSTIDQMIYREQEKSMILSHLCDGVKSLYLEATACEVYEMKDKNQLIAMGSSTVITLEDTFCYREVDTGYHGILLSGREESQKASYPEIKPDDQSMLHIPLTLGGELYALLLISSKNQDAFDDDSLTLARNLKEQLEQVMEKHRSYREAIHDTTHDDITGLFNRRHTEEKILQLMSDHDQKDRRFALVLITLLNLDRIRSDCGDEQMKKHIKDFADHLKDQAKESHLIGRHSENEFILILPFTDRIAVDDYMTTIKKHLNDVPFELMKPHFHYGVSFYPDTARSLTRLISAADQQIVVSQRLRESMRIT